MVQFRFKVTPLESVVLLHHICNSSEAGNDADRTVQELIAELDENDGTLPKGLLESALYCCNMESEQSKFWHPLGMNFDRFVQRLLDDKRLRFDRYYNVITEVKDGEKKRPQEDSKVGPDPQ